MIETDYTIDSDALPLYQKETEEQIEYKQGCFNILAKSLCDVLEFNNHIDMGCGCGYLVKAMRNCNKNSFGSDIGYMFKNGLIKDIKEFVYELGIFDTNKLSDKFDLVSAMEVCEHLYSDPFDKKDLDIAIDNLISISNKYIFITVPTLTHENCDWLDWNGRDPREWERVLQINEIPTNEDDTPILGHVTLATEAWWRKKFKSHGLKQLIKQEAHINDILIKNNPGLLDWWHVFLYEK